MKTFDTRTYSIADFDEWYTNGLLDLSPDFQRRSVWSQKAKSYLIDTILRGKPMPKILITQKIEGKRNVRTVVDGQQRMRAILEFIAGDFKISSAHNKTFARMTYESLDEETQKSFMQYELGCDLLYEVPYKDLLDIFARINTYTVKLNNQELLNAKYLGYFKQAAFSCGYEYVDYFASSGVLSKVQIVRMGEANLASDLLIALLDEIQTNKNMEGFYKKFEDVSDGIDESVSKFNSVMSYVGEIYPPEQLRNTNWKRVQLFYTLFTTIAHALFGIRNLQNIDRPHLNEATLGRVRVKLDEISAKYDEYAKDSEAAPKDYLDFINWARRGTTDTTARLERTKFVCEKLILEN